MSQTDFFNVTRDSTQDFDLYVSAYSSSGTMLAITFYSFRVKRRPENGNCVIDLNQGIADVTRFTITCSNWIDVDGFIAMFQYSAINNDSTTTALGSSTTQDAFCTTLPLNASLVSISIVDNENYATTFVINQQIALISNSSYFGLIYENLTQQLLTNSTSSYLLALNESTLLTILDLVSYINSDAMIKMSVDDLATIKENMISIISQYNLTSSIIFTYIEILYF